MKPINNFFTNLFLFVTLSGFSQIPEGYYDSATRLTGENLKIELYNLIKGHREFPYTSTAIDCWDILKETDKDTANPDNVILFYTGWSVNAAQEYNSGKGWCRENIWAKSHGNFSNTKGPGTDVHHLRPTDISVNSARNNKDFDTGKIQYIDGDGPTECYSDVYCWEPRDAVKGDVARMLFYMAVRYEGENGEPDLELVDEVNTDEMNEAGKGFHGRLSTLLQWHIADPVDSFEIKRNDIIYSYQKNRNPFIDHPEYASKIWITTGIDLPWKEGIKVYPNPAYEYLNIEVPFPELATGKLILTNGKVITEFNISGKIKLSVTGMNAGSYILEILCNNNYYHQKVFITR